MEMRRWKQYLIEEDIEICCVTETHLNKKREIIFREIFKEDFNCIIRNRKDRKEGDSGSGGLAILIKKGLAKVNPILKKGSDEIVWAEVVGAGKSLFIATVYIVPKKSTRYVDNDEVREELELNIMRYKEQGTVLVLGDMNSRIGTSSSTTPEL